MPWLDPSPLLSALGEIPGLAQAADAASQMSWLTILALGVAIAAGAFVQSSIGFGMAVVSAPFVIAVTPELMPGALLITSTALPILQLAQGPRDVDLRNLGWALGARFLTTPIGVAVVALFSVRAISMLVGILILLTVAVAASSLRVACRPRNAAAAGAIAGVSGTAASIGGPFFALVLAGERPERVRATLSVFFLAGSGSAIAALAGAHQFDAGQFVAGVAWLPYVGIGYAAAVPLRRHLDAELLRRAVFGFSAVAGVSVILRALLF